LRVGRPPVAFDDDIDVNDTDLCGGGRASFGAAPACSFLLAAAPVIGPHDARNELVTHHVFRRERDVPDALDIGEAA